MNRLQMIVSIGLFLTLILLGWKSYMSQANDGIKSDVRGMPESVRGEFDKQRAAKKAAADKKTEAKLGAEDSPTTTEQGTAQEVPVKKAKEEQAAPK